MSLLNDAKCCAHAKHQLGADDPTWPGFIPIRKRRRIMRSNALRNRDFDALTLDGEKGIRRSRADAARGWNKRACL